jgi:2-desacetyl-2-hydroxyethyl bacteriochlorophyllide A dehydrogenase
MRTTGIQFVARGQAAFRQLGEPPEPGPTELLIETVYSGVTNGTERHALLTEHGYGGGHFPSQHGYQQVGRVVAVGGAVERYALGDWVFYGGYVGHNGWNVVDEEGLLIRLPDGIDRPYCALFGVAGVALRAARRMGVSAGDGVWVVGQGPIGHFLGQSARALGARVTVSDMLERRRKIARACGAHVVLDPADEATVDALKAGAPYDYIFDCCSAPHMIDDVFQQRLLAHGGTLGMVAVRDRVDYPWSVLHGTEARIETSCHFHPDDLRVLRFLYEQGLIRIAPMVSHRVPVDEAPRIYQMLAERDPDLLGVIFDWTS